MVCEIATAAFSIKHGPHIQPKPVWNRISTKYIHTRCPVFTFR